MSAIRVLFSAGAFGSALFFSSFAAADAVDDLLAGKPVIVAPAAPGQASALAKRAPADDSVLERIIEREPQDVDSLSQEPLGVTLELTSNSATFHAATTSTANMNLVPEPSAVILAVMSLAYFMVFFRRRYSF